MAGGTGGGASDRVVLGLDIGGTKLAAGVVDAAGRVRSFLVTPTYAEAGPGAVLDRLFALGHRAVAAAGPAELAGVGVGCGGPLDPVAGVAQCPPHLPGWTDVPVVRRVEDVFGLPAVLDNDATAAAAGEHRFGAGRGLRHLVYLTLSTGVGGGVVLDGSLYRGATGNGGELGHVRVTGGDRPCACGRTGCLEAYVSGTNIAARAREALAAGAGPSVLTPAATAADVAAAARHGDPLASRIWAETVALLADGLTSLVNLFEPQIVVLGGGVTRSGEALLGPVRAAIRANALVPALRHTPVVLSTLGDRVGVAGAAAVALDRLVPTPAAGVPA
ncbi:MAG: ROK family protein [Mycobacteriales bacterium]